MQVFILFIERRNVEKTHTHTHTFASYFANHSHLRARGIRRKQKDLKKFAIEHNLKLTLNKYKNEQQITDANDRFERKKRFFRRILLPFIFD